VVFADSSLYGQVRTELEQTFDQFVYTPHSERSFYLDLQPLQMFDTYYVRRNLIFMGLLDAEDDVSVFINESLSPEAKKAVRDKKVFEIFRKDLFASEQMVMLFPAIDAESIRGFLTDRGDLIFKKLHDSYFERMQSAMFFKGEQIDIEEYMAKSYGWKMRIQHDYRLLREAENGDYAWFRRLNPDRNLFVYRFPSKTLNQDNDYLFNLRDSIATVFYESDSVSREESYVQYTDFNQFNAVKLVGIWQNHTHYIGGPFRTFLFFDASTSHTYLIDMSVTAPGERKKYFLDQLEVMARTFAINPKS
jgi:hypothetical protein